MYFAAAHVKLCIMKKLFALFMMLSAAPAAANRGMPVTDGMTRAGDILQFAIPLSALAYSAIIGDWRGVKQLSYSSGATFGATRVLKYTIDAPRPYQNKDAKGDSFPSGHTSIAFAGAGYWQMRYGWYVGAPMYAAASFVGYSRIHGRMHNWLDVGTGAALGIGFNMLFTSRYNNERTQLQVLPMNDGAMLRFDTKF